MASNICQALLCGTVAIVTIGVTQGKVPAFLKTSDSDSESNSDATAITDATAGARRMLLLDAEPQRGGTWGSAALGWGRAALGHAWNVGFAAPRFW